MSSINEAQQEIIDEFGLFEDWMDKYAYIIEQGNGLEPLDAKYKTNDNLIDGCQSRVWLQADYDNGKLLFKADSDAVIVKGLLSLLLRVLDHRTPKEILDADLFFIKKIGLTEHLSPTRSNGLFSVIKQMRYYALAYNAKDTEQKGV